MIRNGTRCIWKDKVITMFGTKFVVLYFINACLFLTQVSTEVALNPKFEDDGQPLKMRVGDNITCEVKDSDSRVEWVKEAGKHGPEKVEGTVLPMSSDMIGSNNTYKITIITSKGKSFKYVVFDVIDTDEMTCSNKAYDDENGEYIQLKCEATFYDMAHPDSLNPPRLVWNDIPEPGGEEPADVHKNENTSGVTYTKIITIPHHEAQIGQTFTCRLYSSSHGPSFTNTCTTRILEYNFEPVREVAISPVGDLELGESPVLHVGDMIQCTAKGHPKPSYFWQYAAGVNYYGRASLIVGPYLRITENMAGKQGQISVCLATNTYMSNSSSKTKALQFAVSGGVRDISISPPHTHGMPLNIRAGQTLSCSAKGNPSPKYFWRCVYPKTNSPKVHPGNSLGTSRMKVGQTYKYLCIATNMSFGRTYSLSAAVIFTVTQRT